MGYRQAITNDDGELLGYDTIYPEDMYGTDPYGDDDADMYEDSYDGPEDSGSDEPESDVWDYDDGRYDDDPSPYDGNYSEE